MKLWIARDADGLLTMFDELPYIKAGKDYFTCGDFAQFMILCQSLFPEVTFENSPQEVELKLVKDEI